MSREALTFVERCRFMSRRVEVCSLFFIAQRFLVGLVLMTPGQQREQFSIIIVAMLHIHTRMRDVSNFCYDSVLETIAPTVPT